MDYHRSDLDSNYNYSPGRKRTLQVSALTTSVSTLQAPHTTLTRRRWLRHLSTSEPSQRAHAIGPERGRYLRDENQRSRSRVAPFRTLTHLGSRSSTHGARALTGTAAATRLAR
jgi:hypothetical protein